MWYQIDFNKFVVQMLPPLLRSKVLIKILQILIVPIRDLYNRFLSHKSDTDLTLNTTSNVVSLEKILNDTFFLKNNEIYIETIEDENKRIFYFDTEGQTAQTIYTEAEGTMYLLWKNGESSMQYNFTVYVPTFLCTSLTPSEDKYSGKYYHQIVSILNKFRPAGRTFSIKLYDND